MTRTKQIIDELTVRYEELSGKLGALRGDHDRIVSELNETDGAWHQALQAGADTGALAERRRHLETEAGEKAREVAAMSSWVAEVEDELRRKRPHEALDADLARHMADVAAFRETLASVDGAHQRALDVVVQSATELHTSLRDVRGRSDEINQRAAQLRAEINRLERTDPAPQTVQSEEYVSAPLRGTGHLWRLHMTAIQRPVPDLATGLGVIAAEVLNTRRR